MCSSSSKLHMLPWWQDHVTTASLWAKLPVFTCSNTRQIHAGTLTTQGEASFTFTFSVLVGVLGWVVGNSFGFPRTKAGDFDSGVNQVDFLGMNIIHVVLKWSKLMPNTKFNFTTLQLYNFTSLSDSQDIVHQLYWVFKTLQIVLNGWNIYNI